MSLPPPTTLQPTHPWPGDTSRSYRRVLFTRLEFEWLRPHPPLSLLDEDVIWVQAGEDNGGINDRHWLSSRTAAEVMLRRWDYILDGTALAAVHGSTDLSRVTPKVRTSRATTSASRAAVVARLATASPGHRLVTTTWSPCDHVVAT